MRLSSLSRQHQFHVIWGVLGVLCYVALLYAITNGDPITSFIVTLLICFGLHGSAAYVYEGRSPLDLLHNPKRQSWAYLFGDVLLAFALAISAQAWENFGDRIPWLLHQPIWFVGISMIAFGLCFPFRAEDRKRYEKHGAQLALKNPASIVHQWIILPSIMGALLATSVPLFWVWNVQTLIAAALVVEWGILVAIDAVRDVNPNWQYKLWNEITFEPFTDEEIELLNWLYTLPDVKL